MAERASSATDPAVMAVSQLAEEMAGQVDQVDRALLDDFARTREERLAEETAGGATPSPLGESRRRVAGSRGSPSPG